MSTYLAPSSSSSKGPLPPTPHLGLLPFALGPAHTPFTSSSAPLTQYFQPRPCPSESVHPGIPANTPIATFRGRQLVGQTIDVPTGYRGVVLSAPLPHHVDTQSKWPTPAASVASIPSTTIVQDEIVASSSSSSSGTRRSPRKSTLANMASTIKAKVKGAGQIALSRPKTRQAKSQPAKRKRYQLDSDSDEEGGGEVHVENAKLETPTKSKVEKASGVEEVELPTIVVQDATPLKEPLPTPKKRLGERGPGRGTETGLARPSLKRNRSHSPSRDRSPSPGPEGSPSPSPSPTPTDTSSSAVAIQTPMSEGIIPSPATENDPPTFDPSPALVQNIESKSDTQTEIPTVIPTPTSSESIKTETETDQDDTKAEGDDTDPRDTVVEHDLDMPMGSRILRPTSTFTSFTLWTPDVPIPGFRADELASDTAKTEVGAEEKKDVKENEENEEKVEVEVQEGGVRLRKGWWRTGGGGEGGDEIVRALGEWIGLIEELNRPVYLDDLKDDDSDSDTD